MKKIKSLTEAEIAELPTLPDEWKWARLGELVNDIVVGYVGPITQYLTDDLKNGVRFLSTTHIGDNQFLNHKEIRYVTNEFSVNNKKSEVLAGDIIVARHGDSGKCCIIPPYIKKAQVSNAVIIRPNELFVNIYIIYSFEYLKRHLQKKKVGGVQQVVNTKTMEAFPFPLPSLPEQRAIVSKIEQLFSELDNGIANLKLAQEQLKVYRQAVLKKAFEGELTKKWREQQTDLPDAGDLLEQIRKEREEAAKAAGKKLKSINSLTETELSNLPKRWGWTRLGNLVEEPKYGTSKKCDYNINGIGVLRIPNISDGLINDSDLKFAQFDSTEIENYRLKAGDILTIRSNGSVDLVGKCALVRTKDEKYLYAGYLIRLRPLSPLINSKYLLNCLSSIDLRYQIESKAKSTSGVNNINSGELQSLIIPFCSLPEQQAIVQEIETRLSVCDKIEQDIETNLEKAEALRQSILKKAFEGKLLNERELAKVREAEDWEPAEVLLERIRAEKAGNGKK